MSNYRKIVWLKGDYVGNHERQAQAKAEGCKVIVEFHFNSNGASAKGGETWYKPGDAPSKSLASDILARYASAGLPKHGAGLNSADPSTRAGWLPFYSCSAILLEPLFVSNPDQAAWIHKPANVQALAREIAAALVNATGDNDIVGLSIGHRFKSSAPGDQGAKCAGGDYEADHGQALAQAVAALLVQHVEPAEMAAMAAAKPAGKGKESAKAAAKTSAAASPQTPKFPAWDARYGAIDFSKSVVQPQMNVYKGLYKNTFRVFPSVSGDPRMRVVSYASKFAVDGDGSGGKQPGDIHYNASTSLHYKDGKPWSDANALNALKYPFCVLPGAPTDPQIPDFHHFGLDVGDLGIAFFGTGDAAAFVYGDHGPDAEVGEGSIYLAKALGMDNPALGLNTTPANGGFSASTAEMARYAPGVVHLLFPGSRDRTDHTTLRLTAQDVSDAAWALFNQWLAQLH